MIAIVAALLTTGCASLPEGVEPVTDFDLDGYLGTWFEIARLENRFERGLERVTAEYSMRDDGRIRVVNRGFSPAEGKWKAIEGKAVPVGPPDVGLLKVSFFGPFYSPYGIFEIDREDGEFAFVAGASRSYLWLLARKPEIDDRVIERFRRRASELGFDLGNLILVEHPAVEP